MSVESQKNKKDNVSILRTLEGGEKFTFSFHLKSDKFGGIDKQFNMCRNLNENMSEFVTRLTCNVEKAISKKAKNKKPKPENIVPNDLEIAFRQNGKSLLDPSLKIKDIVFEPETKFDICGECYQIDINPPLVENATLPKTIMTGFMVYPYKLKLESANRSDSVYEWFVSDEIYVNEKKQDDISKVDNNLPNKKAKQNEQANPKHLNWSKRESGLYFTPTHDDTNRYIKLVCHPKLNDRKGLPYETVSKSTVSEGPKLCPFEQRHVFTKDTTNKDEFRVVSYNLLADLYADSDFSRTVLFPQCPSSILAIDYRKQLILKELLGYNADIICLQEVDNKVFDFDLLPILSEKDEFDGVFDRKGGQVSEGLACFWRTSKFKQLKKQKFILSDSLQSETHFEHMWNVVKCKEQLRERMLSRTTAIQIVVLESLVKKNHGLVVGITHLYFKPDADHVRLLQTALCMGHLEKTLQNMKESKPDMTFSVILAGDFNSTPPFGVLQFMREGSINEVHPDWSSCLEEQVLGLSIKHSFSMDSACGTPKFTNYTIGFQDCIDYIFYETDKLEVKSTVPYPTEDDLKKYQAIPNILFPSDHIASISNLKWLK